MGRDKRRVSTSAGLLSCLEITEEEDAALHAIFERLMAGEDKDVKTLYKTLGELADAAIGILNGKAVLGWISGSHSATPVPLFSVGAGAERFSGWHDNTEMKALILQSVE